MKGALQVIGLRAGTSFAVAAARATGVASPPRRAGKTYSTTAGTRSIIAAAPRWRNEQHRCRATRGWSGEADFCPRDLPISPANTSNLHKLPTTTAKTKKQPPPTNETNSSADNNNRKENSLRSNRQTDCGPPALLRIGTLMPDQSDIQRLCESAACPTERNPTKPEERKQQFPRVENVEKDLRWEEGRG